jgi:penicillin amidase
MVVRAVAGFAAGLALLVGAAALWGYAQLAGSLPTLEGRLQIPGLRAPVHVERDALGVPTIRGDNRPDVARATGFLHAQDRLFQMDLQRRRAAGELAELVGSPALHLDRSARAHRFRTRAERVLAGSPAADRALIEAYAEGVNAGIAALDRPPFEYLLLGQAPARWRAADSILTVFAMYLTLQGNQAEEESFRGAMRDVLPEPLYRFLASTGDGWDSPLMGEPLAVPPIPGPEVFDLRTRRGLVAVAPRPALPRPTPGSNNWAVARPHTKSGAALVANDMHLPWSVPNIWYRASLVAPDSRGEARRITGVTLPGVGFVVVGSNGDVAWGFTNSMGDWVDQVVLEPVPGDPDAYRTPGGSRRLERVIETLHVKDGEDEVLEVLESTWGPVTSVDHRGRRIATRWVAHDPRAVTLALRDLEAVTTVAEALEVAAHAGLPAQNFTAGDRHGDIGWTIIGPIPRRIGHDGRLPSSWADGSRGWDGWLAPAEYPRVLNPSHGRIWTANQRVVDGEMLRRIGLGGYVNGARGGQIRDRLLALESAEERDLLAIQLDNRALFLSRWRDLLLDLLDDDALGEDPRRAELRRVLEAWNERAATDSVAYRMVHAYRSAALAELFEPIEALVRAAQPSFRYRRMGFQQEGPLWKLVVERPVHLLDPRYSSWRERLLALLDAVLDDALSDGGSLERLTWGEANRLRMHHPLSAFLPAAAPWLDMPPAPLGGDRHMPNALTASWGPSERMVVSPGQEERGILHAPGGQSGHPLSSFYDAGHEAWLRGEPTPFLPGPPRHRLVLAPPGAPPGDRG